MATAPDADELWRFSLAVYAAPGVAAHCLDLQDRWGADVNVALALAWAGASGRGRLAAADIARLDRSAAPLRDNVVGALRTARRWLKPYAQGREAPHLARLRAGIKELEIEAERCVQAALAAALAERGASDAAARRLDAAFANLDGYLRHLGADAQPGPLAAAVAAWIRAH